MKESTITREQLLKEAPRLVEYAIMRGWMAYPKKKSTVPDHWSNSHHSKDEDIQKFRQTITEGSGD